MAVAYLKELFIHSLKWEVSLSMNAGSPLIKTVTENYFLAN
jgi:hypothetical protein